MEEGTPLEEEDLRAALREMKTYMDITEADLQRIYELALRHARQRLAEKIPVQEVMSKKVVTVRKDADLQEAAHLLSEHKISGMPVLDGEERVIGVISEADLLHLAGMKRDHTFRDLLRTLLGETGQARTTGGGKVSDVMSAPPQTIGPDEDIKKAALLLDQGRIKRLPVVDAAGRLRGIISRGDIVRTMGKTT